MREHMLAIFIALCGWVVLITFSLNEYAFHPFISFRNFIFPEEPMDIIIRMIILSAPIGSTITAYLINERKKLLDKTILSENQLKQAANEWRMTFDSIPYGVFITDNKLNIIRANNYITDISGAPFHKLISSMKCGTTVCKQIDPIIDCPIKKVLKTNKTESADFYDHDNGKIYIESITPLTHKGTYTTTYIHVLVDVTDIRKKEIKITQSKNAFFNMLKDLDAAYKEQKDIYECLVVALSNIIDAKSPWTRGHSLNVTELAVSIAREMNLMDKDIETLKTASLLHDIGKIGAYDMVLDKPDMLDEDENTLIRMHPAKGEEMLKPIKGFDKIISIIRSHHEWVDGMGYPDGLKGDDIPLLARILCVADSYDAMISDRPYRSGLKREFVIVELKRCAGTQFDPQIVEIFLKVLEK
ncbi:MAG TPA: HD domain-containing protein [Nitrospirae bacterium]|nr:cyclic di-GMP phosphodiesterase response regulator RpfG [bacterium BMS3Abin09]GBE41645.1 cyclic di-GMP phosphodiesterase response regulator RpfG [bacterium BMS3Bbin09]HDH33928.1 HD domain-containing protein [Nitrospirota bacterium]HDO67498.1 HD domain-containing protein [Nitrospirota bacterium]HDZ84031.1 HD domain-containing protein [Nitrospirota bacterium]